MAEDKDLLSIRPIISKDIPEVCDLMNKTDTLILGINSDRLFKAICHDALLNNTVIIIVAEKNKHVIGYVVAIVNIKSYWMNFLRCHPVLFSSITFERIFRKILRMNKIYINLKARQDLFGEQISTISTGKKWIDSSPEIAKIINIGVLSGYRRYGIAKKLYTHLFKLLSQRFLKRLDANINFDNTASVKLHLSTGWKIGRTKSNLFASISL